MCWSLFLIKFIKKRLDFSTGKIWDNFKYAYFEKRI